MIQVNQVGCRVEVKGEISGQILEQYRQEVLDELAAQVRIAGFRKGHAPKELVRQHFNQSIQERLTRKALSNVYKYTIEKYNFTPLCPMHVVQLNFKDDSLEFRGYFEVKPQLESLPDYRKIELKVDKIEVDSESVRDFLEMLRWKNALLALKNTQIQRGDLVQIDIKTSSERLHDGQLWLEIGKNHYIDGFDEQIIGLRCGQVKKFSGEFDGESIEFRVKVKKVYQINLPNIDEEFAKNLGYNSLEELEAFAKDKVTEEKELHQKKQLTNMLLDKLVSSVDIPLPQIMLQAEIDYLLVSLIYNLDLLGVDGVKYLQQRYEDTDKLRDKIKPHAEYRLRCILLLEEIAKRENIKFDDEECKTWVTDRLYAYVQKNNKQPPADYQQALIQEYKLSKTVDFLLSQVKVEYQ